MLLAEEDFERFREEIEGLLLEKKIRFHVKQIAIIVFGSMSSPTDEDFDLVLRIDNKEPGIGQHLWRTLVCSNWFVLLYEKGIIQEWLDCDDPELRGLADASLHNAVDEHAEIVAKLLSSRRDMPEYPKEILRFVSWIKIYKSRPLFELLLDAAQTDDFSVDDQNLWISLSNFAKHEPHWMIELLTAYLENVLNRKLDNKITAFNSYSDEAYSVAGGMGFGWWLVEHYLPYHVDCPNSCGLGEPARGRKDSPYFQVGYGSFDNIPDLVDPFVESFLPV